MRIAIALAVIVRLRTLGALELPATEAPPADPAAAEAIAEPGTICSCWNGAADALVTAAD